MNHLDKKISIYFFVVVALIVSLLSYAHYQITSDILLEHKTSQVSQEMEQASEYISNYLDKIKALSNMISMSKDISKITLDDSEVDESLLGVIQITQKNDPFIQSISIISKDGKVISTGSQQFVTSEDMLQVEWYKEAVQAKQMPMITGVTHSKMHIESKDRVISISNEIVDENQAHVGLVLIDLSYQFIEEYVSKMNFQNSGYTFITTAEEKVLFDTQKDTQKNEIYLTILHNRMKMIDQNFIAEKKPIPRTNWLLIGVASMQELESLRSRLFQSIVLWFILILGLTIILALLLSKQITQPIKRLISQMKHAEHEFETVVVDTHASVEVQTLTKEYNALLQRTEKLTKKIAEKENARRIYEVKSLQSQINPHFIYNTLETILWLTELQENQKAIQVTKSLGLILRNTLNINQDFIPLSKEIEHVKNYLEIQKIRYEDLFEYSFDIEENCLELEVPKLILQPIVENAIYHGIRPKKEKSFIKIVCRIVDEKIEIDVIDNGIGPVEKKTDHPAIGGIGMKNVDQRIKLLCGDDCGITFNREDGLTRVHYVLSI